MIIVETVSLTVGAAPVQVPLTHPCSLLRFVPEPENDAIKAVGLHSLDLAAKTGVVEFFTTGKVELGSAEIGNVLDPGDFG